MGNRFIEYFNMLKPLRSDYRKDGIYISHLVDQYAATSFMRLLLSNENEKATQLAQEYQEWTKLSFSQTW